MSEPRKSKPAPSDEMAQALAAVRRLRAVLPSHGIPARRLEVEAHLPLYRLDVDASIREGKIVGRKLGTRSTVSQGRRKVGLLTRGRREAEAYLVEGHDHAVGFTRFVETSRRLQDSPERSPRLYVCDLPLEAIQTGKTCVWRRLVAGARGCPVVGSVSEFLQVLEESGNLQARESAPAPRVEPSAPVSGADASPA